jgi:hypothetical protein
MQPAVPKRPPRDLRLDVLRGWMQVSIFVSHAFGTAFAWAIHASWGVSDSSEQFVLLSGLSLGSVFALKRARDGFGAAALDLARRTRRLWVTHLVTFFAFAALVFSVDMFAGLPGEVARMGWTWLAATPWLAAPAAATTLYQPEFMGILPIFLWCMLLLAPFLWLLERVGDKALALPIGLYVVTQVLGLAPMGLGGSYIAFDPFAWQLLFLLGAWLGRRALLGAPPLPRAPVISGAAVAILALGLWMKLGEHGVVPAAPDTLLALVAKDTLGPLRLLHALALAWLVAVFVPRQAAWMESRAAQALAVIGRHSLQVFCLGLFLSYAATVVFRLFPDQARLLDLLLIPAGIAILLAHARRQEDARYRLATARSQ